MARKLLGFLLIITGLFGLYLSIAGLVGGRLLASDVGTGFDSSLGTAIDSLKTTRDALTLSTETVDQVSQGLETLQGTADSVSNSIEETRPFLEKVSQMTSQDLPGSLDAVQNAVPAMADSAAVIDDVLTALSDFQYGQTILGVTFALDLGIDYAPAEPFDVSVNRLGESLEGMPEQLRSLEVNFQVADDNLAAISGDIAMIGGDLTGISGTIAELNPILEEYVSLIDRVVSSLESSRERLAGQIASARRIITLIAVWFALFQLLPLYYGYELSGLEIERLVPFLRQTHEDGVDDSEPHGEADSSRFD